MEERLYWLGFSAFSGVGPIKFKKLLAHFGSAKSAWSAKQTFIQELLGEGLSVKLEEFRRNFSIEKYAAELKKKNVSFLIIADSQYPTLLSQIKNPPFVLYVKGKSAVLGNENFVPSPRFFAVVGTRRITNYGREVTEMFVRELVSAGFTIVSGLAIGVDAVAHQSSLESGGKTIAVLGCGVDCCTPAENKSLYNSIVGGGGVIVSELPLGHPPTKGSFPSRNRIIAGLSLGVLVTEGAEDSGSLITADYGLKFNRKVFAVPGPITSSLSKGPYKLISRGAKLVTTANDIIRDIGVKGERIKNHELRIMKGDTKEEQRVLGILENEPMHFDEIARATKLDSAKLGSTLSIMEMKGMIKSLDNGLFAITS